MNNYSVTFSISGYYFQILTHDERLLEKQVHHIRKFCITSPVENVPNKVDIVKIEYLENLELFKNERNKFFKNKIRIVQSFEGIFHLKYEEKGKEYFCQLGNEWILVKKSKNSYVVLGNGVNETTKYVFRIIREMVVRKQEEQGKIFMHATGIVYKDIGLAILGNKKSGKTTFFTKILEKHNASIISNDRVFFYKSGKGFYMDYFPIPVVYRAGTVINSEPLKEFIIEQKKYSLSKDFMKGEEGLPVALTDLPQIFRGIELKEKHSLDVIIFTRFHLEWEKEYIVKTLSYLETVQSLMEVCFTPIDYESKRKEWLYYRQISEYEMEEIAFQLIEEISKNIRAIYVEFGKNVDINDVLKKL